MTQSEGNINVVLADDHVVIRKGIKVLLENDSSIKVVSEASNGEEAIQKYIQYKPDVLVMDIRMPVMTGLQATGALKQQFPDAKVLILSMHDDEEYILEALERGAVGYILKDANSDEFLKAIRFVHEGGRYFSGEISNVLVKQYFKIKSDAPVKNEVTGEQPSIEVPVQTKVYDITKREKEILRYVVDGLSSKDIAAKLGKSVRTIEAHRFNIMKKLEVKSALELVKKVNAEPSLKDLLL